MMIPDEKYEAVKALIETERIEFFTEIFRTLPKTKFAKDIDKHPDVISRVIANVNELSVEIIVLLSDQLDIDPVVIFKLAHAQYVKQFKKGPRAAKESRQSIKKK